MARPKDTDKLKTITQYLNFIFKIKDELGLMKEEEANLKKRYEHSRMRRNSQQVKLDSAYEGLEKFKQK